MKTLSFLLVARENLKNAIFITLLDKFLRTYLILPLVALLVLTGLGEHMSLISEIDTFGDLQFHFSQSLETPVKNTFVKAMPSSSYG